MPVNRQHGADVGGIRAWGSLQQEVEPGSAVCEWGCPQNTLTPRLHTLARPQEGYGPFSGMACSPVLGQSGRYPALCFSRSPFPQQEIPRDLWVLKVKYSIDGSSSPGFLFKMNMKRLIHLTSRICLNISEFWFWVEVAPWPLPSAWSPISPLYFPYSGGPEPAQVVSTSRGLWVPAFLVETPLQRPQGNLWLCKTGLFNYAEKEELYHDTVSTVAPKGEVSGLLW